MRRLLVVRGRRITEEIRVESGKQEMFGAALLVFLPWISHLNLDTLSRFQPLARREARTDPRFNYLLWQEPAFLFSSFSCRILSSLLSRFIYRVMNNKMRTMRTMRSYGEAVLDCLQHQYEARTLSFAHYHSSTPVEKSTSIAAQRRLASHAALLSSSEQLASHEYPISPSTIHFDNNTPLFHILNYKQQLIEALLGVPDASFGTA